MEGIKAQQHFPHNPPLVCASHPGDEAASLMQIILMEKVYNKGAKSNSYVATILKYALSSWSLRIICIIIAEIWN